MTTKCPCGRRPRDGSATGETRDGLGRIVARCPCGRMVERWVSVTTTDYLKARLRPMSLNLVVGEAVECYAGERVLWRGQVCELARGAVKVRGPNGIMRFYPGGAEFSPRGPVAGGRSIRRAT